MGVLVRPRPPTRDAAATIDWNCLDFAASRVKHRLNRGILNPSGQYLPSQEAESCEFPMVLRWQEQN
jgi:hypothetical protein